MKRCPVCGDWRWKEGDAPDWEGHHPDCGVNLRRRREAAEQRRRQGVEPPEKDGPG